MSAEFEPGHRRPEGADASEAEPEPKADPKRTGRSGRQDPGAGDDTGSGRLFWLLAGAVAIAAGTALGWNPEALASVVTPPPLIRAALVGGSVAFGVVLLLSAVTKLAGEPVDDGITARPPPVGSSSDRDVAEMIRGVRLVFLAVAAFAAASGWLLGHPLPLVVALVIAGVDVLETSFLLIVFSLRSRH